MNKDKLLGSLLVFLMFLSSSYLGADKSEMQNVNPPSILLDSVGAEICNSLDKGLASFQIGLSIEKMASRDELFKFYKNRECHPAWSDENGVNVQAISLIYAINHSNEDGLNRDDPVYNLKNILAGMEIIKSNSSAKRNPVVWAQLDILLTDAYFMLGKHFYYGLLPRETVIKKWFIPKKKPINLGLRLENALREKNIQASLEQLSPSHPAYKALKKLMIEYRKIESEIGLKEINSSTPSSDEAVKLKSEVEEKISTIRLNMERWRWMPDENDSFYVLVNIPDFSLSAIKDDKTVLRMKAVVGKEKRHTPILNANMKYIVVNPYWNVPTTILREDIFPKVRKDIRYLKKEKIRIFKQNDSANKREISPYSINWKKANADSFSYRLRQDSGVKNALGRLKFIFPNSSDIYIHDTPSKYLFDKEVRTFSSGCIRIQEPVEFAQYLLKNDNNVWGDKDITALINNGSNKYIFLSKPVKVRIHYWTVWVDDDGVANFRDDVYGYDRDLAKILGW
ncbi:MAG: L,D-transpeptidase family protein [Campylobacterales bacterium]|nr:L,D-transpeptidase family protein [Campylobacterales bacterium]